MKVFSTFTGIGGFEIGIENAYSSQQATAIEQDRKGRNRGADKKGTDVHGGSDAPLCVGYSEIDKYASSVFNKHYPGAINYGDITKINHPHALPDFDVLVGGFPCQAFSVAGKRKGFEDTRGTLFFDLARILKAKTPRLFVFENVKGLLNHDNGNTFKTIIATIDELGYDCQWQVLNSKDFGVPQNRERVIIVGHLRGTPRPEVFPLIGVQPETRNADTRKGRLVDLTRRSSDNFRERKDGRAGTLDANYYKGIANQERPGVVVGTLRTHKDGNGFREMQGGVAPTLPARAREDGSGQPVIFSGLRIRRLSPVECERLQAFPDDWTKYGAKGELISDTQRYKMCGNAVTTNVIQAVFERIFASA